MRAFEIISDLKIAAGIDAGEFDDLPGFGKPLDSDPLFFDPNQWIRAKLRLENLSSVQLADTARMLPVPGTSHPAQHVAKAVVCQTLEARPSPLERLGERQVGDP